MATANTAKNWQHLLQQLLLGTNTTGNNSPPDSEEENDALALLLEAGRAHLLQKSSSPWQRYAKPIPAPPQHNTSRPTCSWRSLQHLDAILKGHHAAALPEFVRLLNQYGGSLPMAQLPQLLERCLKEDQLWLQLQPVLDERANWLAKQHPRWSALVDTADSLSWRASLPLAEQLKQLKRYRLHDAQAARDSLIAIWSQLNTREQGRLLAALAIQLSQDDEAWLEECRHAKRKEVRNVATELLALLPDSALVGRLWDWLAQTLILKDGHAEIDWPEELPKATTADGITPKGSKLPGGLRANWLYQLVSRVPLWKWTEHWNLPVVSILNSWRALPEAPLLLGAAAESLNRHWDEDWAAALAAYWLHTNNETLWQKPAAKQVLERVSDKTFNSCLLAWLEQHGPLVPEDSVAAYWLSLQQHNWDERLSKIVLGGFRDIARNRGIQQWNLYHYNRIFEAAAYRSDVALFDELRQGWTFNNPGFGRWSTALEKLLQTMHFRRDMRTELAKLSAS